MKADRFTRHDVRGTETTVVIESIYDESPDASWLEQEGLGFEERLQQYRNGDFHFVGIRVRVTRHNWQTGHIQVISSGGLWGVESDADEEYIRSIAADEWAELWVDNDTAQTLNSWLLTQDSINTAEIKDAN